ncbi:putative ATPase (AAA+ superfamily) [Pyrobaculum oguniense TE7]|uniref:ATPase (AAA+ superfamily) n=1 Tax=Pyrobaculum oguniense (strain DSM 13380 / JCM 10595 / TE7) TaxID=698757 RepID=H6Q879_PYROT|nr:putative ATPase (AAA+ superfamily) [Pyrobaculum oguniense TE7]
MNFVYGPRQTGKTTGLKLLVRELLRRAGPDSVAYLDLDIVLSPAELKRAFEYVVGREARRGVKRLYLLLDEVTSVRGWWRVLKYYVDTGVLDRAVVVATGSSTVGLLKTPERFPGRRGLGRDVVVLPLDFPAYVEVHGVDPREPAAVAQLFEEYLETGGFPKAINRHPDAVDAVRDAAVSETYRHGRSPQLLKDILGAVLEKIPSPMSYHAVAQEVGVSHNTVREYVEFLADIYAVGVAHLISGGKPQTRREKKIFFRDPLLYRAAALWTSRRVDEAALLEQVVQEHLLRKYGEVYYYRNKTEIDVVAGPYKIEMKSARSRRGYPRDVAVLRREEIPKFLLQLRGAS